MEKTTGNQVIRENPVLVMQDGTLMVGLAERFDETAFTALASPQALRDRTLSAMEWHECVPYPWPLPARQLFHRYLDRGLDVALAMRSVFYAYLAPLALDAAPISTRLRAAMPKATPYPAYAYDLSGRPVYVMVTAIEADNEASWAECVVMGVNPAVETAEGRSHPLVPGHTFRIPMFSLTPIEL